MSNLKTEFQNLASELINDVFADIAVDMTLVAPISESYDAETGDLISSTSNIELKAILGPFSRDLVNAQDILVTDTRCVIPFQSLDGHEPIAQIDILISIDGTQYDILQVSKDAAEAAYVLQLRKTNE